MNKQAVRASSIGKFIVPALFLVVMPMKSALIAAFGVSSTGSVVSLSTTCKGGNPIEPKARITVTFVVDGKLHSVGGSAGDGNAAFCNIRVGDQVKVAFWRMPFADQPMATVGNATSQFFEWFIGGLFLSAVSLAATAFRSRR